MDQTNNAGREYNRSVWAQAWLDLYQRLAAFARKLTGGNSHDAEDLLHDTLVRALQYAKDPQLVGNKLGYLFKVMRNVWNDTLRKRNRAVMLSLDDPNSGQALANSLPPTMPTGPNAIEVRELMKQLEVSKGSLPPSEKRLLELHLEGLSCDEIARRVEQTAGTTKVQLNAVRTKIRTQLIKRYKKQLS